jgi:hypothetical protein
MRYDTRGIGQNPSGGEELGTKLEDLWKGVLVWMGQHMHSVSWALI